ncbi:hypothetical protein EVAR_54598_1 [Eumeta japonica]|uniref:Uncharacterized protein n=1 Tax=Eumeta variegata TaxID=151549 RepID=A0A4C1YQF0_EUMVA|nr:hypothetical protein EVAR_54598_1 [Eumeta japonica]
MSNGECNRNKRQLCREPPAARESVSRLPASAADALHALHYIMFYTLQPITTTCSPNAVILLFVDGEPSGRDAARAPSGRTGVADRGRTVGANWRKTGACADRRGPYRTRPATAAAVSGT